MQRKSIFSAVALAKGQENPVVSHTADIEHPTYHFAIREFAVANQDGKHAQGFTFVILGEEKLKISLTHNKSSGKSFDELDTLFRNALSILHQSSMTSREIDKIVTRYESFVKLNGLMPSSRKQSNHDHGYRPGGSAVF